MNEPAWRIHTLLCHTHVSMAIRCLGSLHRYSHEPLQFVIHDDGSLDQGDSERLIQSFPSATIIRRADADPKLEELLRKHPACADLRRKNPFGLKLFDTTLLCEGPELRYCDTDILFFRPHRELFHLPESCDAIFMADTRDAYSLRSWQVLSNRLRLVEKSNAGMMCFRRQHFDLDRLEWFFRIPMKPLLKHFVEQTAWAMLAAPLRTYQWDPTHVRLIGADDARPTNLVAGHYVATYRNLLDHVRDEDLADPSDPPITVRLVRAQTVGATHLALEELGRLSRRFFPRRASGNNLSSERLPTS
jgi:hypothetical protein